MARSLEWKTYPWVLDTATLANSVPISKQKGTNQRAHRRCSFAFLIAVKLLPVSIFPTKLVRGHCAIVRIMTDTTEASIVLSCCLYERFSNESGIG